jgi:hypothetical protein
VIPVIRARCKAHLISPKGSNTFVKPRSSHFSIPGGPVAHSYLSIVDDSSLLFASAWAGNLIAPGDESCSRKTPDDFVA